ncbi:MAG: hypothetical protein JWM23_1020 [Microbacteriaceae bacterium]|nr:hypothetical protein [Microbacteriaceae bacterium]
MERPGTAGTSLGRTASTPSIPAAPQWVCRFTPPVAYGCKVANRRSPVADRAPNQNSTARWGFSRLIWTLIVVAAVLVVIGISVGGAAGLVLIAALVGAVTAVFSLATGRGSWARLASKRVAAATLALCLVATVVSASLVASARATDSTTASSPATPETSQSATSGPTPTPIPPASVAFTEEAPEDPEIATQPTDQPAVAAVDSSVTSGTALALLATIPVKGKAAKTGYGRTTQFGAAWLDVDRNGCDTRNDILARDLTDTVLAGRCTVLGGSLAEPYTGAAVRFVRGNDTSALVQIDHVVALSNAWQTGAQQLTPAQRMSLANDPLNLLAVDGRANAQKSDGDAATWLPAVKSFRCAYVARQISVKATYGLWVAPAEHDAMARVLSSCADQPALTSAFTPAPAPAPVVPAPAQPTPEPAPVVAAPVPAAPAPAPAAPSSAYYENCTAVRAAGAAPIRAGDPGYSRKLDRDGDGVACE